MKKVILVICAGIVLSACSGGAGNSGTAGNSATGAKPATTGAGTIEVKLKDKSYKLEPKALWFFSEDWTINLPDGKNIPTSNRYVVAANYDLETTYGRSNTMKKIESADNVRVMIALQDKENVTKDAPPTVGDYGPKLEEFQKLLNVQVFTMESGMRPAINISGSYSDNKGGVKIISVSGDTVTGEIDFSNTENTIKGPFTAKIWKQTQK